MLRLKDFNTAYWGRVRTAPQPYPCHEKVNAFIGQSGSGKTTMMDALRMILGDARFENNRGMDHYIYPKANWAVVQATFWNRWSEGRPFVALGFLAEEVTVCVRLDRTGADCKRDYYMFDGSFLALNELGQTPKLYQTRWVSYTEYLKRLETVGLTPAFRQLMTMRPEDVRDVISLQPHRLFDLIFDLKGTKKIKQEHDAARERMGRLQSIEKQSEQDLAAAQVKLTDYEAKKAAFDQNQTRIIQLSDLSLRLLKRRWWDATRTLEQQRTDRDRAVAQRDDLTNELAQVNSNLAAQQQALAAAESELRVLQGRERSLQDQRRNLAAEASKVRTLLGEKERQIQELEQIPVADMQALQQELQVATEVRDTARLKLREVQTQRADLLTLIQALDAGAGALPGFVTQYIGALQGKGITATLLADCLSVREEYLPWLDAIEALLGRERYRVVVSQPDHLPAKKLQEQHEYGARVSLPRPPRRATQSVPLKGRYPSVYGALTIDQLGRIGGFLDHLHDIYLVDTVEEGHALQQEGYTTLTRKGLLQDQDGSLFYRGRETVCGRVSRERQRSRLARELAEVKGREEQALAAYRKADTPYQNLEKQMRLQEKRLELPDLHKGRTELYEQLTAADSNSQEAEAELERLQSEWAVADQQAGKIRERVHSLDMSRASLGKDLVQLNGTINGYRGNIARLEQELTAATGDLRGANLDEHAIAFIEVEVTRDYLFVRPDGSDWTQEALQASLDELQRGVQEFKIRYPDLNQAILAMVESQRSRVDDLQATYEAACTERKEWESPLADAEFALRNHVRETMQQYIEEFTDLSTLLGAQASGRFEQDGHLPEHWRLQLKVAFDGKELLPYNDPEFSSGQRAAISIMLLLAAVNNRKDGLQSSLMFLDEPTSRVDDARANEIGLLLQQTNIQYFVTHQISASLTSVDWIDSALVLSKTRSGEDFADDPILEIRRVLVE